MLLLPPFIKCLLDVGVIVMYFRAILRSNVYINTSFICNKATWPLKITWSLFISLSEKKSHSQLARETIFDHLLQLMKFVLMLFGRSLIT